MRRIVLWALSTLSVVVLLFGYSTSTSGPAATSAGPAFVSGAAPDPSSTSAATSPSSGTSSSTGTGTSSSSGSGSGSSTSTATGQVVQTRWGPVQVQLTMSGSAITKVAVLQYPNGNGRDQEINSYALPVLIKETMQAQSAQIDMVSGATYTSDGYAQSLQSALDQANA